MLLTYTIIPQKKPNGINNLLFENCDVCKCVFLGCRESKIGKRGEGIFFFLEY